MARSARPLLILETGKPVPGLRRHGDFPHWIRVAAGIDRAHAVAVDATREAPPPHGDFSGAVVTGSPAMVTERAAWSERAADWLRGAADAGLPLFGICYGHQLLAHALGGEVGDNPAGREMGTIEVDVHGPAERDAVFGRLPRRFVAQASHLQTVLRPPPGATVLARSAGDGCQAFRWGDSAWGVQFHPEFSATHMRGYVHARREALARDGLDPDRLARGVRPAPYARLALRRFAAHARHR
ncbi:glutamine amidotransferase [Luteimonas pelagia]